MKNKIKIATNQNEIQCLYSQDWEYYDYGNCKRHLQIIFPYKPEMNENEKYPLILFIPGSAWHKQEMYNDIPQYAMLAKRGFVVAAMEYRESDIAAFPAQIEDVYNALNFIPSIANNFHIDTDKIFLMGNSSGGHIAMMSVLFNAHGLCNALPKISGVICESGSTDLLICAKEKLPPWLKIRPSAVLLGVDKIEGNEELAKKASCSMYISEDIELPPILLIHSEHDPVVSVENSRTLYDKLAACHHHVFYYELEGSDAHGGVTFYDSAILDIIQEFCIKGMPKEK
ncbi:MAG: alpha/beta hydrolase [Clostridiales bacterium]|nr:alpha/beta hydrolase [Clostridiales bacterium]